MIAPPDLPDVPVIVAVPRIVIRNSWAHASNFSRAQRTLTQAITIHCTDGHEGTRDDDNAAAMFADPKLSPHRSAHYVVDADSATCCVPDMLTAYHCGHTGNMRTIGVELCGRANQTRDQWLDGPSMATLSIAARLVAALCAVHHVPPVVVNPLGLMVGDLGITTHAFVSAAWKESTHNDPGVGFPLAAFVVAVGKAMLLG